MKILLIGVGGVGCEFLLHLANLSINKNNSNNTIKHINTEIELEIAVVDDDTVEGSNLCRQRLFQEADIGRSKVSAARDFLLSKYNFQVTPIRASIEKIQDPSFFLQFDVFILAIDNLDGRRWLNSTLFQLKSKEKEKEKGKEKEKDFIVLDLGVQGFKWSIRRLMIKGSDSFAERTACFECTNYLFSSVSEVDEEIPVCSIYGQPRNIKDCIQWALPRSASNDLAEIYKLSLDRAIEYCIDYTNDGTSNDENALSYSLIIKLQQKSIPAVASINSFLAAKAVDILFKSINLGLEVKVGNENINFWYGNMESGFYSHSTTLFPDPNCYICKYK